MAKSACMVVTDRGYLGIQKAWRAHVAEKAPCLVVQVESDVVVPVAVTSEKEAYSAGILRPKLQKHLKRFLVPLKKTPVKRRSLGLSFEGIDITNTASVLKQLSIDGSVTPTKSFIGGTAIAEKLLERIPGLAARFPCLRGFAAFLEAKVVAEIGFFFIPNRFVDGFPAIPMSTGIIERAVPAYPEILAALGTNGGTENLRLIIQNLAAGIAAAHAPSYPLR